MLRINAKRLIDDLNALAQIGRVPPEEGGGIDRRPFSPAERGARRFFESRAREAGLEVSVDGAANLSACLRSANATQTILTGSHLDSVPHGGPYDGALGVIAALEALRTIGETGIALNYDLEAIAFTDEEGRLGEMTGSRALSGTLHAADLERFLAAAAAAPDDLAATREFIPGGLTRESILASRRDPQTIAAYVELHIEQGPQLEHLALPIGIVEAIFGRRAYAVLFHGRSDHAGTTPLFLRADAAVAAAHFVAQVHALVGEEFPKAVATCGNIQVEPGVYNVVPNRVEVWLEFRAGDETTLVAMDERIRHLAEQVAAATKVQHDFVAAGRLQPAPMNARIQEAIAQSCSRLALTGYRLASGALHDAHSLAQCVPAGMIFVPSIGGRSHSPDEMTRVDDLVAGANVLLHTLLELAQG